MTPVESTVPTLARLSFWVSSERMAAFGTVYEGQLSPILENHGLEGFPQSGRAPAEGVFSRLFEVETPVAVTVKERALRQDLAWQEALQRLGEEFPGAASEDRMHYYWGPYAVPAGPGRTVAAGPGFRQGVWHAYGTQDGLPHPNVHAMLQDQEGHLWLAAYSVCRYDGAQFTTFTVEDGLVSCSVMSVLEDRQGHLWFGTLEGVICFDGKTFVSFTTADGLVGNSVQAILEDREGCLWFGTGKFILAPWLGEGGRGVSRYDGEQFVSFTTQDGLTGNEVLSILEDREGNLWFGTDGGVSRYDGTHFESFTTADGLVDNSVWAILEDREGNLWFGTDGEVSRYDGTHFESFTVGEGLTRDRVMSIAEDPDGTLWFGTFPNGVTRYDGERFTTFTTVDGLGNNQVMSILPDRDGHLWFGTLSGITRYDGAHITSFTTADGLANNGVMSVLEDRKGRLWFGTWGGVSRYDGQTFTTLEDMSGKNVYSIVEDGEGHLWFGATVGGGVTRYDGERLKSFTTEDGLSSNGVVCLLEDRKGRLWVGTGFYGGEDSGVDCYDGERFTVIIPGHCLSHHSVISMLEDGKGNLWIGTQAALVRYDGEQLVTFAEGEAGAAAGGITALLEDRAGHLWFGTFRGVNRYDGESFVTFTTEDGLTSNVVLSLLEDDRGHLWMGTWGGGVVHYDGLVFQSVSRKDGLVHDTAHEIIQDVSGDFWITTEGGVTRYRPQRTPPTVRIEETMADRRYGPVREVQVPASQRFVSFTFQGSSLTTRTDGLVYVCCLEGHDDAWQPVYAQRMEYRDLPLGEYTFQVKAVDRDLNYSEPAEVHLQVVRDPRDQQIDELEQQVRERTQALQERTQALEEANLRLQEMDQLKSDFVSNVSHDLRLPLTSIKGSIDNMLDGITGDLSETQTRSLRRIQGNANRLSRLINDLLDLSRIEAGRLEIHPMNLSIGQVARDVLETVESLAAEKGISLGVSEEEPPLTVRADPDRVYQILTNLVGNALKFTSEGGEVEVGIALQGEFVCTAVRDTGEGIPPDQLGTIFDKFEQVSGSSGEGKGAGLGLSIARSLVELQGGQIWVESEWGKGSTFYFTLPLAEKRADP